MGSQPGRDAAHDAAGSAAHDPGTALVLARSGETAALAPSEAVTQEEDAQGVKLPVYSTRGTAPGLRGCWAIAKTGLPCGAPRRNDSDYCTAHAGYGVAANPKAHSRVGVARSAENRRRRADLRLAVGVRHLNTPRGVLAAETFRSAERIASRVVGAVLDPSTPADRAARLGLDLIDSVDPQVQATITTSVPTTPEGVGELSLTQLMELGSSMGLTTLPNGSTEPMGEGKGNEEA